MVTRNILPGCQSTQPNTHSTTTARPLWYLRHPHSFSSISSLVRSGDLLRATLEIHQHGLFAELVPVSDVRCADVTLLLHNVCWSAAHDILCEDHNLHKSEVTLLRPRTMPDGSGCWGQGSRSHPATSPSQTVLAITVDVPGHVTTAHVTRQLVTKKPHDVLQELTRPSPCYWIGKCVDGMLGFVSISRRWYSEITLPVPSAIILLA